jgi:probable HAF family extracellular repeat protein
MVLDHELSWPFQPLVRAHRAYVDRRMWWRADIARLRLGVAADSGPIAGRDMSGRLRRCVLVATVAIVGVLNAGAARADARGSVDLGTLGGSWSEPVAVNSAGHVIGDSETVDHRVHAFLADASRMVDLGSLARRSSYAVAINSSDTVVGYAEHKYYPTRGFIWRHGVMTDLGSLGGSGTVAVGLNDRDQVVGASRTADRRRHAFLWSAGQMIDLAPRSRCSFANAINDRGEVVGVFANDEYCAQQHIFLWRNGVFTKLPIPYLFDYPDPMPGDPPRGFHSWDPTINNAGVIGGAFSAFGDSGAETVRSVLFRWQHGVMTYAPEQLDLSIWYVRMNDRGDIVADSGAGGFDDDRAIAWIGSEYVHFPPPQPVYVYGIDDHGWILGSRGHSWPEPAHYFRWQNGVEHDFATSGLNTSAAGAVSAQGQIVVSSGTPPHATLWTFHDR